MASAVSMGKSTAKKWHVITFRHDKNGVFVFPTHSAEMHHNRQQLLKINMDAPVAKMTAVNTGPHAKIAKTDQAGGLLNQLYLCVGSKVMLTTNLAVSHGLFNGAIGFVREILYLEGRTPSSNLPDVVMVNFPGYLGPPFTTSGDPLVPIFPVEI